jgi:hypothetical protein
MGGFMVKITGFDGGVENLTLRIIKKKKLKKKNGTD